MNEQLSNLSELTPAPEPNKPNNSGEDEIRQKLLTQILDNEARERLKRIGLVKEQRARQVEDRLIELAKSGRLAGKVSERQLIQILEGVSGAENGAKKSSGIRFERRKGWDDEEDEEFDL